MFVINASIDVGNNEYLKGIWILAPETVYHIYKKSIHHPTGDSLTTEDHCAPLHIILPSRTPFPENIIAYMFSKSIHSVLPYLVLFVLECFVMIRSITDTVADEKVGRGDVVCKLEG